MESGSGPHLLPANSSELSFSGELPPTKQEPSGQKFTHHLRGNPLLMTKGHSPGLKVEPTSWCNCRAQRGSYDSWSCLVFHYSTLFTSFPFGEYSSESLSFYLQVIHPKVSVLTPSVSPFYLLIRSHRPKTLSPHQTAQSWSDPGFFS
jgi:hypothetical protein